MIAMCPSGPSAHPLLGILPAFQENPLQLLTQCHQFPDVAWLRYGVVGDLFQRQWRSYGCLLNQPEDIHHVLTAHHHKYLKTGIPPAEAQVFGNGILHSQEPLHLKHRQLLQPSFHPKHYAYFGKIIVEETVQQCTKMHLEKVVDISQSMTHLTLKIISRVLFGKVILGEVAALSQAITVVQHQIAAQYRSLSALLTPLWFPTASHRLYSQALTTLNNWIFYEIQTRRQSGLVQEDVLSRLLETKTQDQEPLTDTEIRDELMTLFLAGHETTANALTWLWYQLTKHPEIKMVVDKELYKVLQGRLPMAADVEELLYCKSIVQEVLRLYPPAWILHLRNAQQVDELPSGIRIPKGTEIWVSPYAVQRNPCVFRNPDQFDPRRFNGQHAERNPHAGFLPFGAGPRRCLGEGFAMLEAMLVVSTLLSVLEVEALPDQDVQPDPLMTLRMRGGFWVKIKKKPFAFREGS